MVESEHYQHYFDIDPEYFSSINEAVMKQNPDLWKKFYPHETFVKLLKDTVSVLKRKQKKSIWVEGAYGTGKSHAVFTLKEILNCSDLQLKEYFQKYGSLLGSDLYNELKGLKGDGKRILTVHRYGASNIHNDHNLIFAIQTSIANALKTKGINNAGITSLKDSVVRWLSQPEEKNYFNSLLQKDYADLFYGDGADDIIQKLNHYSGDSLLELMEKISKVGSERSILPFTLDDNALIRWIKDIIQECNLKAIVFIWDEFTEFFENNPNGLSGFQHLAELSETAPFYFVIVTHNSTHLLGEKADKKKVISDRFISVVIQLPENMAIRLMGAALEKKQDPQIAQEWKTIESDLYRNTNDSRKEVEKAVKIEDNELRNILPIHPYAALVLKNISSIFDSNQRSMFDFIKNDQGDKVKGFQWFIKNMGSLEEGWPLLTIDYLWDFFYGADKSHLPYDIQLTLDTFEKNQNQLFPDEKRVLKTVLLLQVISTHTANFVDIFIPNEKNLDLSFNGTDFQQYQAVRIANKLVKQQILYRKPLRGGKFVYSALIDNGDTQEIEKKVSVAKNISTADLIKDRDMLSLVDQSGALNLRYVFSEASVQNVVKESNKLDEKFHKPNEFHLFCIMTFAKNKDEASELSSKLTVLANDPENKIIYIDTSTVPMGTKLFQDYADAKGHADYYLGKNNDNAKAYEKMVSDTFQEWKHRINIGGYIIYSPLSPNGRRVSNTKELNEELLRIDRYYYPQALECTDHRVLDTMWNQFRLNLGVECGATQITKNAYKSSSKETSLENLIGEAWKQDNYWNKYPYLYISKIKMFIENNIQEEFKKTGRFCFRAIYEKLTKPPYGFMPCSLTAFILGFLFKEYTTVQYNWTDTQTSEPMSIQKLEDIISKVIKHQTQPGDRYVDSYIAAMTEEQKAFINAASRIFTIPINKCTSIEETRSFIRESMIKLSFPIWSIKYIVHNYKLKSDTTTIDGLIDSFVGVANSENLKGDKSDNDYANDIGRLCIDHPEVVDDLKSLINPQNCSVGMNAYLKLNFKDLIALSNDIQDGGQYLNQLKSKIDAGDANWLWNQNSVDDKIKELIQEYQITKETNKALRTSAHGFQEAMKIWNERILGIHIPYDKLKSANLQCKDFLKELYDYAKISKLPVATYDLFIDTIVREGEAFNIFYSAQVDVFTNLYPTLCAGFGDNNDAVHQLYNLCPPNAFTMDVTGYTKQISKNADRIRENLASEKLRYLWKEKTGTESPLAWSQKYRMPILIMVDMDDQPEAREAFSTINTMTNNTNKVESALSFLKKANFFDRLENQDERDHAFREEILGSYSVVLTDIEQVKDFLQKRVKESPYNWDTASKQVKESIEEMAQFAYDKDGSNIALKKIDDMDAESVKKYLRKIVKENMTVGLEIIKEN